MLRKHDPTGGLVPKYTWKLFKRVIARYLSREFRLHIPIRGKTGGAV